MSLLSLTTPSTAKQLRTLAEMHSCNFHPFFDFLASQPLACHQLSALLRNYDVHASILRRLLLKAASIMPEPAVGFVLENVRNEYGNGNYKHNHQNQLRDLARQLGISQTQFLAHKIEPGIRKFARSVVPYYYPLNKLQIPKHFLRPAIVAGAITATELLAIKEFIFLQKAFSKHGLQNHIWFHHVTVEAEHLDESLALALYFINHHNAISSVELGMQGVLDANIFLYDGLLQSIQRTPSITS